MQVRAWLASIHGMLSYTIHSPQGFEFFFFKSELSLYENFKDAPAFLEPAIWESKIAEQHGQGNWSDLANMKKKRRIGPILKVQSRIDSVSIW